MSDTNMEMIIGVVVGMAVGGTIGFLIRRTLKKKGKDAKYDERQRQEQARAEHYAFWLLIIWNFLASALYGMDVVPFSPAITFIWGAVLAVTVYAIYCIVKEAYFGINQSSIKWTVIVLFCGLINLYIFFKSKDWDISMINFCCGVMCTVIPCVTLGKYLIERSRSDNMDDEQ